MDFTFIDKKIEGLTLQKIACERDLTMAKFCGDAEKVEQHINLKEDLTKQIADLRKQKDDLIERHYRVQCEIYREHPSNDE